MIRMSSIVWVPTAIVMLISSALKPQVSDAISGENSEVEQTDTKQSLDNLDEK